MKTVRDGGLEGGVIFHFPGERPCLESDPSPSTHKWRGPRHSPRVSAR